MPSTLTVMNLCDSGPGSLRAAVAGASSGDTINFARGLHGTITLTSNELSIGASVTIDGPGANTLSVSGNNSSRVFEIASGQVAISGLTITDGNVVAANGGGIFIDPGATLDLDQVVMTNNSAYADSAGNYGSGGGIENDGSLTVTNCLFTSNLASGGSFNDPITEGSAGGAIDSQGPALTVTDSTFWNNQAVGPFAAGAPGEGNGGAINNSSAATITNSTFNGNLALGRNTNGGAISAGENELITTPPMAISDCTFTNNQAKGGNDTNNFTEFYGGQAAGGAILSTAPLTINASTFTDNLAKGGDGGNDLIEGVNTLPVVGEVAGGGICEPVSSLTVTNSTFAGNRAIGGNNVAGVGGNAIGGGITAYVFASTTLTNVTFAGNQAIGGGGGPDYTGGSGFGGGFYNGVDSTAAVSGCLFSGNLAQGGAGGSGGPGVVGAGGAIANGGGEGALEGTFLGLGADTSSVSVAGSTLIFNVAQGGAGGVGSNGGNGSGGGCYVLGTTTASIDETLIAFNAALGGSPGTGGASGQGIGGGLYIDTGAGVTLTKSSKVILNFASTSADDIFGVYTTT